MITVHDDLAQLLIECCAISEVPVTAQNQRVIEGLTRRCVRLADDRQGPPERIRADRGRGTRRVRGIRRVPIELHAEGATSFVIGSAMKHPIHWCSATTRCTRARTRLHRARPRSAASVAIWPHRVASPRLEIVDVVALLPNRNFLLEGESHDRQRDSFTG